MHIFCQIEVGLKKQWGCTGPNPGAFNAPLLKLFLLFPLNIWDKHCFYKYGHRNFLNKHSSWLFCKIAIAHHGELFS